MKKSKVIKIICVIGFLIYSLILLPPLHEYSHCIMAWKYDSSDLTCDVHYTNPAQFGFGSYTIAGNYRWFEHPLIYTEEMMFYGFLTYLCMRWIKK